MNNLIEIFPEWIENGILSSVFLQKTEGVYTLLEKIEDNHCFYFNTIYETYSKEDMDEIINLGKEYQKILQNIMNTNSSTTCIKKDENISFYYKKDGINYEVYIMDNGVKCGKKMCEPCDFLTYLTLGKMTLHGSSFLDMEYRGKGFGLTMYDIMDKNSELDMIPHGYPFELNLSDSGRKFWLNRNKYKPVISYNKDYYYKIKNILTKNKDLENVHLQITSQNFEYQIKEIMFTLLTALKYDLNVYLVKDINHNILNISCFELFSNNDSNVIIESMNSLDAKDFFINKIKDQESYKKYDYGILNNYRDTCFAQRNKLSL